MGLRLGCQGHCTALARAVGSRRCCSGDEAKLGLRRCAEKSFGRNRRGYGRLWQGASEDDNKGGVPTGRWSGQLTDSGTVAAMGNEVEHTSSTMYDKVH
ncbi:hypothetical protein GUJ93_ZPchr0006g43311 [Zizania palustris]|uniref:Uncharacterized protein n=1 Tax=Zizania palustris TaxID=103762 RepID=A0A8J5W1G8_ZIZPA|nr:hypothetical protein GUJ93_ZPchr0006g43311 [Zizania palustris]